MYFFDKICRLIIFVSLWLSSTKQWKALDLNQSFSFIKSVISILIWCCNYFAHYPRHGRWNLPVCNIPFAWLPRRNGSNESNELPNIPASKWYCNTRSYRNYGYRPIQCTHAFTIRITVNGEMEIYFCIVTILFILFENLSDFCFCPH